MRTAGLPNFRKLWGRIEVDLKPGTYELTTNNKYDVDSFEGSKSFVISDPNILGGKNYFLAYCYLSISGLCFSFALIYFISEYNKQPPKKKN